MEVVQPAVVPVKVTSEAVNVTALAPVISRIQLKVVPEFPETGVGDCKAKLGPKLSIVTEVRFKLAEGLFARSFASAAGREICKVPLPEHPAICSVR